MGIMELNQGSIAQLVEHMPYKQNVTGAMSNKPGKKPKKRIHPLNERFQRSDEKRMIKEKLEREENKDRKFLLMPPLNLLASRCQVN